MELAVSLQAGQFALAAAVGLALAVVYDLLRGLRKTWRFLTVPLDLFFCLITLFTLAAWSLYVGQGRFRLFFWRNVCLNSLWG